MARFLMLIVRSVSLAADGGVRRRWWFLGWVCGRLNGIIDVGVFNSYAGTKGNQLKSIELMKEKRRRKLRRKLCVNMRHL